MVLNKVLRRNMKIVTQLYIVYFYLGMLILIKLRSLKITLTLIKLRKQLQCCAEITKLLITDTFQNCISKFFSTLFTLSLIQKYFYQSRVYDSIVALL